jgi:hypothetical protein
MGGQAVTARQPPLDDVIGEGKHQPFCGIRLNVCKTGSPGGLQQHVHTFDKSVTLHYFNKQQV